MEKECTFDVSQCSTGCFLGYHHTLLGCAVSCDCATEGNFENDILFNCLDFQFIFTVRFLYVIFLFFLICSCYVLINCCCFYVVRLAIKQGIDVDVANRSPKSNYFMSIF